MNFDRDRIVIENDEDLSLAKYAVEVTHEGQRNKLAEVYIKEIENVVERDGFPCELPQWISPDVVKGMGILATEMMTRSNY